MRNMTLYFNFHVDPAGQKPNTLNPDLVMKLYNSSQDVKPTFQSVLLHRLIQFIQIARKPSIVPKKIPTCAAGLFSTSFLEPYCARPRFQSLTLTRYAHSAS